MPSRTKFSSKYETVFKNAACVEGRWRAAQISVLREFARLVGNHAFHWIWPIKTCSTI